MEPEASTEERGVLRAIERAVGPQRASELGRGPKRALASESIVSAFERRAAMSPHQLAVKCGTRTRTYAELDADASRIARLLRDQGVGQGDRVALLLPRSIDAVVAILAVIRSGAAYVPIDTTYPEARIQFIVADCGASFVITTSSHMPKLAPGSAHIALDTQADAIAARSGEALASIAGPEDPLYVIYTSGSTGQPKGASVTQRAFANLLHWYIDALSLDACDATLLVSALGFDLTQKNIFAPLLVGGTLHLPDFDTFDPQAIVSTIEAQSITFLNCTPSTFLPLAEGLGAARPERLSSLRWVVLGGETIPIKRLLPWLQHASCNASILNTYGPTECTDICAAWAQDGRNWDDPVPLGKPIDNVFLAVLDEHRRPVGVGIEGELWIGGAGVGLGYLGRPAMNAERFMVLHLPGYHGRMYRTGDRVSWRPDGVLDFLGRFDHQIKIRGFRVELGEIEAALCTHSSIREACVVVHQAGSSALRLTAYVVPRWNAGAPQERDLRLHMARTMPDHMIPSAFVILTAMPLSPNGKIDRNSLLDPAGRVAVAAPAAGRAVVAEPDSSEAVLLDIWRTVLRRQPDCRDQNFFDAGGTSLSLAEVQAAIRTRLGKEVPIVALFAHPTIVSLARHLDQDRLPQGVANAVGLKQREALRRFAMARGRQQ